MKTSNKLLIAFAAALILLPILGIAIVSGLYYEKGERPGVQSGEFDTFGRIPKDLSEIAAGTAFQSVVIDGGDQMHLVVKLITDKKSGIKFPVNMKGLITAQVDSNGRLQIKVKKGGRSRENFTRIFVYGSSIKQLSVVNSNGINLAAIMDSLQLILSNTGSAHFDPDAKIGKLSVRTTNVQNITFRETNTRSVNLVLNNTNVRSDMSSFDDLSIQARGTSEIELNGGYGEKAEKVIHHLTLNTLGKAKVKIFNLQIGQCSGRFSDSTQVEMPAVNINQMYKSKK